MVTAYTPRFMVGYILIYTYAHWPLTGPGGTPTVSSGPALSLPFLHTHLHALVPSEQRRALSFQDSCIHVGQGPDDYVLYHPQAPPMSRFKPFPSELVAVSSLTMSPVKSC